MGAMPSQRLATRPQRQSLYWRRGARLR